MLRQHLALENKAIDKFIELLSVEHELLVSFTDGDRVADVATKKWEVASELQDLFNERLRLLSTEHNRADASTDFDGTFASDEDLNALWCSFKSKVERARTISEENGVMLTAYSESNAEALNALKIAGAIANTEVYNAKGRRTVRRPVTLART